MRSGQSNSMIMMVVVISVLVVAAVLYFNNQISSDMDASSDTPVVVTTPKPPSEKIQEKAKTNYESMPSQAPVQEAVEEKSMSLEERRQWLKDKNVIYEPPMDDVILIQ